MTLLAVCWVLLPACEPAPIGSTDPGVHYPPTFFPSPPAVPPDTGTTEPLQLCDLSSSEIPAASWTVESDEMVQNAAIGGQLMRLGYAVATVEQADAPDTLLLGAPGVPLPFGYTTYINGTEPPKVQAEIWVFDGPLPQGTLERSLARSILLGREDISDANTYEGSVLVIADLTGDGVQDIVSAADDRSHTPYSVIPMPLPTGESLIEDIAVAQFDVRVPNYGIGAVSVGDWNLDGFNDIALGGTSYAYDVRLYGAEVIAGPPIGSHPMGVPDDGAVAWFDLFEPSYGGPGETGLYSTLVPDVTGDGAADLLVSDYMIGISPKGWGTESFSLFAGNTSGGDDHSGAFARIHVPCEAEPDTPENMGDVTGDSWPDFAIRGPYASFNGPSSGQHGAIWLLSGLHTLAESPPSTPVSLTDYSGAVLLGHLGEYLADMVGLDINQDGQQDLAVLTEDHLYLFVGPVLGIRDLNEADLVVNGAGVINGNGTLAAGDLTGDGIPEIVVGDPIKGVIQEGEVRVYSGAALLSALP